MDETTHDLRTFLSEVKPLRPIRGLERIDIHLDAGAGAPELVFTVYADEIRLSIRARDIVWIGKDARPKLGPRLTPLAFVSDTTLSPLLVSLLDSEESEASDAAILDAFPKLAERVLDSCAVRPLETSGMSPDAFLHVLAGILLHGFGDQQDLLFAAPILSGTPGGPAFVRRDPGGDDALARRVQEATAKLLAAAKPTAWTMTRRAGMGNACTCVPVRLNDLASDLRPRGEMSSHERLELDILLREFGVPAAKENP